jgi:hypothetical protein
MSLEELQDCNCVTRECVIRSVFVFGLYVSTFKGSDEYGAEIGCTRCGDSLGHGDAAVIRRTPP